MIRIISMEKITLKTGKTAFNVGFFDGFQNKNYPVQMLYLKQISLYLTEPF